MSVEEHKKFHEKFIKEVWLDQNLEALGEYYQDPFSIGGYELSAKQLKDWLSGLMGDRDKKNQKLTAVEVHSIAGEGDTLFVWQTSHLADGSAQTGVNIYRFKSGKIAEGYWFESPVTVSVAKNLKASARYHELDPKNMDEILTKDFTGENNSGHSWNLEMHKKTWTENRDMNDTIIEQFGSMEKVCTRFTRKGLFNGKHIEADTMHIKTFRDGKIAHIWEYFDRKQIDERMES